MTSAREVLDSMTGFEELAAEKATGKALETWAQQKRDLVVARIAAAVLAYRAEPDDGKATLDRRFKAAWDKVQAMTQTEAGNLFDDEEDDEPFPDEPVTDLGKDSAQTEPEPTSSPGSVSPPE